MPTDIGQLVLVDLLKEGEALVILALLLSAEGRAELCQLLSHREELLVS